MSFNLKQNEKTRKCHIIFKYTNMLKFCITHLQLKQINDRNPKPNVGPTIILQV